MLGIDPGLTRCGFAVVDAAKPSKLTALSLGVFRTSPSEEIPSRLADLQRDIADLIDEFTPQVVAVERLFFQVNVRTAMSVGQASGVVLSQAALAGCRVVQYTPNEVKQAVAGYGAADKAQVQRMVQQRLQLSSPPKPADAADAAALALCFLSHEPVGRAISKALGGTR